MKNLAIVPARSGSKGLPDKNVRPLGGRPLLAWTVEAALGSGEFVEVMVSTDSEAYASVARRAGASVPFLRSAPVSMDSASSWDAVAEVLGRYAALGETFDTVCLLQPTSPLRSSLDIKGAYGLYREKAAVAVVSVCEAEHSPLWCGRLPEGLGLCGFLPDSADVRRQDAGEFYRVNGAIYVVDATLIPLEGSLYREGAFAYVMPQTRSVDIDTELDFKLAECCVGETVQKRTKANQRGYPF